MNEYINILFLFIAGCAGGFLSGLLGVGGGIIFVPIFDYFLRKNGAQNSDLVSYTLANSFFSVMVAGFAGSISAFRNKMLDFKLLLPVALSAVLAITITTVVINAADWYSPIEFKIFFSLILVYALIKTLIYKPNNNQMERMNNKIGIVTGGLTGVIAGLSGVGGGVIMIPMFTVFGKMDIKKASVLSLAVIPLLAFPNLIIYMFGTPDNKLDYSTGYISWMLVIPLVAGVISTVKLGLKTAKLLSADTIKTIFAAFIIITLINIITSI